MTKIYLHAIGILSSSVFMIFVVFPFLFFSGMNDLWFIGFGVLSMYLPMMYMWALEFSYSIGHFIDSQFLHYNFIEEN